VRRDLDIIVREGQEGRTSNRQRAIEGARPTRLLDIESHTPWSRRRPPVEHCGGPISGAVVDDHDFEIDLRLGLCHVQRA